MQLIDHLTCSFPAFWKIIFALLQCPLIRVRVGLKHGNTGAMLIIWMVGQLEHLS